MHYVAYNSLGGNLMAQYASFQGRIQFIEDAWSKSRRLFGCNKLISLINDQGDIVNFIVQPSTYFINFTTVEVGDLVIGFYDTSVPVPLIFPPQYQAIVMSPVFNDRFVTVDEFNDKLISSDGMLQLNIISKTTIRLTNNQTFQGTLAKRPLAVVYGPSTRSIPAITTPEQIIVLCR